MNLIRALHDDSNPKSLSARFRRARAQRIEELIETIFSARGEVRIIDLGGDPAYWRRIFDREFLEARRVSVTLINPMPYASDDPMLTCVAGDACALEEHPDLSFDMVHSNSVVEHVGDWPRMEAFAAEVRRLAPAYYVQTPYYWFPYEPHYSSLFFHWSPEPMRARALLRRRHGFSEKCSDMGEAMREVQEARLLDKQQFRFLFPDAEHYDEKAAGLTKSLIAVRTRAPALS
jgi:hypothetical protein